MIISREWHMPNHETFSIPSIGKIVNRYLNGNGTRWIDPFARDSSLCAFSNDVNPATQAGSHLPADEFLKSLLGGQFEGCLFDPPYSLRQVKECYQGIGREFTHADTKNAIRWTAERDTLSGLIEPGGVVLSFGWTTTCMGKKRGFEIEEILIVSHGPAHNDTLVTVERKARSLPASVAQDEKVARLVGATQNIKTLAGSIGTDDETPTWMDYDAFAGRVREICIKTLAAISAPEAGGGG